MSIKETETEAVSTEYAISYSAPVPKQIIDEYVKDLGPIGGQLAVEDRGDEVFGGYEWLVPTAIVLFVTRKYFETLLEEAAKEHYVFFKEALAKLVHRTRKLGLKRVGTQGKLSDDQAGFLSVCYRTQGDEVIRFVFGQYLSEDQESQAVAELVNLLGLDGDALQAIRNLREELAPGRSGWRVIARFDESSGRWFLSNEMTGERRILPPGSSDRSGPG